MKKSFDEKDVAPKPYPKELTDAILNVILAWPVLESALTFWISEAIKVRPSETGILLGAMETRTKIDKLKSLYAHRKDKEAAALLKELSKAHRAHVDIRNTLAHAQILGASKFKPKEAYFMTSRAVPEQHGFMVVLRVPIEDMVAAARFAKDSSRDIRALLKVRGLKS